MNSSFKPNEDGSMTKAFVNNKEESDGGFNADYRKWSDGKLAALCPATLAGAGANAAAKNAREQKKLAAALQQASPNLLPSFGGSRNTEEPGK